MTTETKENLSKEENTEELDKKTDNPEDFVVSRQKEANSHSDTENLSHILERKEGEKGKSKENEIVDSGDEYISDSSSVEEHESEDKDNTIEIQIPQEQKVLRFSTHRKHHPVQKMSLFL